MDWDHHPSCILPTFSGYTRIQELKSKCDKWKKHTTSFSFFCQKLSPHQRETLWAYLGSCTHGLIPSSSRRTLLWYNFTGCLAWVPDGQAWKTDNRNWQKGRGFNVLLNSLFIRDIRCEGPGPVPSFDESKESQNRVKKCFEERKLFVLAMHAEYWGSWQVLLWWQATIIIFHLWK